MGTLLFQWHADPFVLLMVITLIYFHYWISKATPVKNRIYFWSAIALIGITTCSPLHFLGMHVYFSAHMITHVVLLLIAGPLLVMSIGPNPSAPMLKRISAFLYKRSWLAWLAAVGIMWYWHIPSVFDGSFSGMSGFTPMPVLHAGSMLLAGILFCWPLVGPVPETHIHPLSGIIYLATACISCSLLGLLITFAPINTFHHYWMAGSSMNGMLSNPWGLTPAADQQAAGLIMWVPCCFVYLSGCLYLLRHWFAAKDPNTGLEPSISLTLSINEHE
jgi:cytochrome c oxidase assembly factor CtaG